MHKGTIRKTRNFDWAIFFIFSYLKPYPGRWRRRRRTTQCSPLTPIGRSRLRPLVSCTIQGAHFVVVDCGRIVHQVCINSSRFCSPIIGKGPCGACVSVDPIANNSRGTTRTPRDCDLPGTPCGTCSHREKVPYSRYPSYRYESPPRRFDYRR